MLWPETSTYAAFPPSVCGRRDCAQKRQTSATTAIPAALFVRSTADRSGAIHVGRGTTATSASALLLIADHELRLIRRGRVFRRAEERRHVCAAACFADQPAVVRSAG